MSSRREPARNQEANGRSGVPDREINNRASPARPDSPSRTRRGDPDGDFSNYRSTARPNSPQTCSDDPQRGYSDRRSLAPRDPPQTRLDDPERDYSNRRSPARRDPPLQTWPEDSERAVDNRRPPPRRSSPAQGWSDQESEEDSYSEALPPRLPRNALRQGTRGSPTSARPPPFQLRNVQGTPDCGARRAKTNSDWLLAYPTVRATDSDDATVLHSLTSPRFHRDDVRDRIEESKQLEEFSRRSPASNRDTDDAYGKYYANEPHESGGVHKADLLKLNAMASSPIKLPSRSARKEHARERAYSKYTLGKPRDKKSNCFSRAFWCCGNGDDSELGSLPSEASFPDAQTYQALPPVRSRDRDIPPPTSLRPRQPFQKGRPASCREV